MKIIRKAIVIGLGNIAVRHRRNLKLLFPEIFIIALSSSGKIINQNTDFADQIVLNLNDVVLEGVDIVIIASPSSFHKLHAEIFLLDGIPTLIEKPVTSNSKDAYELIKIIEKNHTPTAVGYCLRYMPSAIKMKELLDQKKIGNIYNAFVDIGQYLPDWRPSINHQDSVSSKLTLGGGVLLELSHEIDYLQWLLGSLKVNYSQLRSSSELNLEVEELVDLVLISEIGTVCYVHMDFLQKKASRTCSFIGEKGRLDWDLINNRITLNSAEGSRVLFDEADWDPNQMYLSLLLDFFDLAAGRQNSSTSIEEATKTLELIEDIKNSAFQGIKQ
jgi:predicted dehydrogenase